jgi:hypothetical protein
MKHKTKIAPLDTRFAERRVRKIILCGMIVSILALVFAVPALAAGELAGLDNLTTLLFSIARVIGIGVIIFGVIQFGMSMSSHDSSQRVQGILAIAGGLIICLIKEIISALGVSV